MGTRSLAVVSGSGSCCQSCVVYCLGVVGSSACGGVVRGVAVGSVGCHGYYSGEGHGYNLDEGRDEGTVYSEEPGISGFW